MCLVGLFKATSAIQEAAVLKTVSAMGVQPTTSLTDRILGIARNAAATGQPVDVVVGGVVDVMSDGAVAVGDAVGPSNLNAGRCASLNALPLGPGGVASGQVLGRALTSQASGGPIRVLVCAGN